MGLTNNDILKKLRVALKKRDDDIIKVLKLVDFNISKSELSAFFRSEDHPNYMVCKDQLLRNFLNGLIIYKRGPRWGLLMTGVSSRQALFYMFQGPLPLQICDRPLEKDNPMCLILESIFWDRFFQRQISSLVQWG